MRENPYKDLDGVNEMDLTKHKVQVNTEKEQIKKRIFSRPIEGKEFDVKVFHLLEAIIFQPGLIKIDFQPGLKFLI